MNRPPSTPCTGPGQFVDEPAAALGPMRDDEFEVDEAGQMDLQLGVTPAELLAELTASEPHRSTVDRHAAAPRRRRDRRATTEQPPGLRWQLIEGLAEHLGGEPVRQLDVRSGRFDVGDLGRPACVTVLRGRLVLMQQSDRPGSTSDTSHDHAGSACVPSAKVRPLARTGSPPAPAPGAVARSDATRSPAPVLSRQAGRRGCAWIVAGHGSPSSDAAPSSTVNTRQRFNSSSSTSIAVVVKMIAVGPLTL